MNNKERIPVFYACDDNFVKYTIVSMHSMMANASKEYQYRIHILNTDIREDMKQLAYEMQNENFEIQFDDVTDYLRSINDKLPLRDYYSKTTYYRMFIAEMYPEYEKAIYIDSDTIVLGDISGLYEHDLGDCFVGAARDQVMIQIENYGDYAEKVLGIDRDKNFNAGLLLINCKQFRENFVLDQFIELLHQYNFVVTQDEDYLNLICKNHVLWLDQKWNSEVFGEIITPFEEIQILHYIMVSKPWHYEDCRLGEVFWKYAKETKVYEEIRQVLADYTDEQRAEDQASGDRLYETAKREIAREDNYLNQRNAGKLKSVDRLMILEKIARYEKEGRFDEDVENDPPTKELMPEDIDYLRKKLSSKIKTRLAYKMARTFLNDIVNHKKMIVKEIKGIENFANLDSGAIVTCNHFNAFDSFAIQMVYEAAHQRRRKFYRVIREGNYTNFSGFYGVLMRNCNTLPLSSNIKTMKKFIESIDKLLRRGHFVLFYPEQSMWWNYRKPKPLKKGAYTFAVQNNVPVLPCFITMQDSDIVDEDGFYVQEYTVHVSEPIYPNPRLNKSENIEYMKNKNYELWKKIYEDTYKEPLTYSCDLEKNACGLEKNA